MSAEAPVPTLEAAQEDLASTDAPRQVSAPSFVVRVVSVFLPVVICVIGIAFAAMLVATRPEAARTDPDARGVPVRVTAVAPTTASIAVHAQGQVIAAQQVRVQPEVAGRVVWMSENLVPGGRVRAGERLVRIDPRDYQAALENQRAQLESQRLALAQENSRRVVAEREWALMGQRGSPSEQGRGLALREPQREAAQATLRAAETSVQQARTNLGRTTLTAPFDGFVQAESAEMGQLVTQASQLATIIGTGQFWVQVSVPMEQLSWIQLPEGDAVPGSSARVAQLVGERGRITRTGRVVRLLGDLDTGRMARVLVAIDDPLGDSLPPAPRGDPAGLPLLIGASVRVEIDAGQLADVYEVPRSAVHADGVVHVLGADSRLALGEVEVVWRREDTVLVRGLTPGALVITSNIPTPLAGTLLRRIDEAPADEAPADEAPADEAPANEAPANEAPADEAARP